MKPGYRAERRKNALKRLEAQLTQKQKYLNDKQEVEEADISAAQIKRIKKEIEILKSRT